MRQYEAPIVIHGLYASVKLLQSNVIDLLFQVKIMAKADQRKQEGNDVYLFSITVYLSHKYGRNEKDLNLFDRYCN